jgi:hypothetical protein
MVLLEELLGSSLWYADGDPEQLKEIDAELRGLCGRLLERIKANCAALHELEKALDRRYHGLEIVR